MKAADNMEYSHLNVGQKLSYSVGTFRQRERDDLEPDRKSYAEKQIGWDNEDLPTKSQPERLHKIMDSILVRDIADRPFTGNLVEIKEN